MVKTLHVFGNTNLVITTRFISPLINRVYENGLSIIILSIVGVHSTMCITSLYVLEHYSLSWNSDIINIGFRFIFSFLNCVTYVAAVIALSVQWQNMEQKIQVSNPSRIRDLSILQNTYTDSGAQPTPYSMHIGFLPHMAEVASVWIWPIISH